MGKLLGWIAIGGTILLVGWYMVDPVSFAHNPLMAYLKDLSNRSGSRIR